MKTAMRVAAFAFLYFCIAFAVAGFITGIEVFVENSTGNEVFARIVGWVLVISLAITLTTIILRGENDDRR